MSPADPGAGGWGHERVAGRRRPRSDSLCMRPTVRAVLPLLLATAALVGLAPAATAAPKAPAASTVRSWLTTADARSLLAPVGGLSFGADRASAPNRVVVDERVRGQVFHGAGAALTESSAVVLSRLPAAARDAVVRRLFDPVEGIGLSMARLPLGATDFSVGSWTYDDVPAGDVDPDLRRFTTSRDDGWTRPLLRQAAALQPALTVLATPWTAPAWMKTGGTLHGGSLRPEHVTTYARYLARSVAEHRAAGIPVGALTLANEPGHDTPWYPSMALTAEQSLSVAAQLPAALQEQGVQDLTVLGHDHNWDDTAYPSQLLRDPVGSTVFGGTAFHCYAGEPGAQQVVADAFPTHEVWMTECSGGGWATDFGSNLAWNAHNLVIGNLRASGSSLLLWNLALDPSAGPTNGGCSDCRGVVTVDPVTGAVRYSVEYYVLGQLTKAVVPGAVRLGSTSYGAGRVESVAFRNPDGTTAVVLHNNAGSKQTATVVHAGRALPVTLAAGAVQTLLW
jgi:glucosylceramidase